MRISLVKPALLAIALCAMAPAAFAETITVYTAYEEDEAAAFLAKAKEAMPDIDVNLLRLSTGDLVARIISEEANPRHDVIWGMAATSIVDPRILGTLEPYAAKGIETVPAAFRDPENRWFAVTGYMAAFCVNKERIERLKLPMPTSWEDLTKPEFKGEVVMPNPASSGTGYLQISSLLQMMGPEKGWDFISRLDKNIAQYIKSGSKPCTLASQGEYAVGVSFDLRAIKDMAEGYPIQMVIPSEGAGNELEANGLVKTSQHKEAAKRFLDWTLTPEAASTYYSWKAIVTVPGGTMPQRFVDAGLPSDVSKVLFKTDFARAGQERSDIIATWQKRFER